MYVGRAKQSNIHNNHTWPLTLTHTHTHTCQQLLTNKTWRLDTMRIETVACRCHSHGGDMS